MPHIDFYIITDETAASRLQLACRLIEKAYKNRQRIYIHTDGEPLAHQLDELLWTYREDSFLPHNIHGEGPIPAPPIQIGFTATPTEHRDLLINLNADVPGFYKQFTRVFEIVPPEATSQSAARERYRYYRNQGHEINTHKIHSLPV